MKLSAIGIVLFFTLSVFGVEHGSLMTTVQEVTNLANNNEVKTEVINASKEYLYQLTLYRQGKLSFASLQSHYDSSFSHLLSTVKSLIIEDTTGTIVPIQLDYDSSHQSDYEKHLQMLIGLVQETLNIPPYQSLLPPIDAYNNLLANGDFSSGTTGWQISEGSGNLKVNSPDPYDTTTPVENKNSLSFERVPPKPGYISVSQKIATTPNHIYLVGGYVIGSPPGNHGGAYSGGIDVTGAISITSSITGKTTHFSQTSNELDQSGLHRRFYWVKACNTSMTLTLSGGAETVFKNIVVTDITKEAQQTLNYANTIFPPVSTSDYPDVGHYPQVERKLNVGDNLLDGSVSIQENIDQSALKNAGHPYWYIDGSIQANHSIKITNALNGAHALYMPTNASITTNGPVPCPIGEYTLSLQVYIPEEHTGKINLQFSGTSLIDNTSLPKISQDFTGLIAGQVNPVQIKISSDEFQEMPEGTFFRPSATITNTGDAITVYGVSLIPEDRALYDQINNINPYEPDRSWYQQASISKTYDFTTGKIDRDWAVALTGNTMFAPGAPACDFTKITTGGIQLVSKRDNDSSPPYANGGIQSTQFIPSGHNFSISMTFTASNNGSEYEPTVALWTYGESQRGPESSIYHTNAPGTDPITEFDCEMGSDITLDTPPPENSVYVRDGSYIGHAVGGHSEYFDTNDNETPKWKEVPNFWDEKTHKLTMEGNYSKAGHLILTRILDNTTFSIQDVGPGPFSPMYVKIALENPNWNSRGLGNGQAQLEIQNITIKTSIPNDRIPTISITDIDYSWFTPGGGGACSYTPFQ